MNKIYTIRFIELINCWRGGYTLALLERIVSTAVNVFVADTRELAVQAAIAGLGIHAVNVPRTVIWPTLERFTNDNGAFPIYNPSAQNPDFVWSSSTQSSQSLGLAASSSVYTFSQNTSIDINVTAFADNAMQMQIDLVNADTNLVISSFPLGTLLNDGNMNPATGVTIEQPFFPYNWQNVRFYSVSTGIIPAGRYKLILSFTVVNYEQFPGLDNPAALAFDADIHEIPPLPAPLGPCGMPSCRWVEDPNDPIFNPPTPAYYETVRYDTGQFVPFGPPAFYKMWYDNFSDFENGGGISLATSPDGINWTTTANIVGLSKNTFGGKSLIDSSRHSRVLFDRSGFGIGVPYRIWYWDSAFLSVDPANPTTLPMLITENSNDGINWFEDTVLQQDPSSPLLPLKAGPITYTQCYGPADVLFFPGNPPILDTTTPFNNRYVMYYNISDGNIEELALAVSADGIFWRREGPIPVLSRGAPGTWDSVHATEGAVVLRLTPTNFMMWYSGGIDTSHEGIGCATSTDGLNWVKFPGNPIFSVFSGPSWRTGGTPPNVARTHNPWVLFSPSRFDGHGDRVCFKFWFTGGPPVNNTTGEGDDPQIGYALNLLD
jgi:hypothetical protein